MLSGRLIACVLVALASALAFAVATVAQFRAAARSSDDDARSTAFVGQLLRSPLWWSGTLGNGLGYVLQAVALALGPLTVVSPLIITSLLFALPIAARFARTRLTAATWTWALVLAVSLGVFVGLGNPSQGHDRGSGAGWLVVAVVCAPVVAVCLLLANRREGAPRAGLLALADGVLAGVNAVLTKSVVSLIGAGLVPVVTAAETYALLVVGLSGVYLQQLAFQAGALQASLPVIAVVEPVLGAGLGIMLLRERLDVGTPSAVALSVAAAAMATATVFLARSQARAMPELDAAPAR